MGTDDPDLRKLVSDACECPLSGGKSAHDGLRESAFAVAIGGKADIAYCTAYVCF